MSLIEYEIFLLVILILKSKPYKKTLQLEEVKIQNCVFIIIQDINLLCSFNRQEIVFFFFRQE